MEIIYNRKRECGTMNLKDLKKSLSDMEDLLNKHMSSSGVNQKEKVEQNQKLNQSIFSRLVHVIKSLFRTKFD